MTTMQAVRAHRRGGPEQFHLETAPRPEPGPGEVLLAVRSASITVGELAWDATWTDSFDGSGEDRLPTIPSHEVSGVVAALGEGVDGFTIGQSVYGLIPFVRDGAAAEFTLVPVESIAPKPEQLSHDQAAAVPLAGLTAWQGLVRQAGLRAGQRVLVHGGAGGVGSFVVQLAAALDARVVATAGAADASYVQGLGAERVIDYRRERFEDELQDVDVVFDTIGADNEGRSWQVLRPGGVLVSIVAPPDAGVAEQHGVRGVFFVVEPDPDGLAALSSFIDAGRIRPQIDRVVPLERTPEAYTALEKEHRRGKIVLHVSDN